MDDWVTVQMVGWMDGWIDGWMDGYGWIIGLSDKLIDYSWMDEWTDGQLKISLNGQD